MHTYPHAYTNTLKGHLRSKTDLEEENQTRTIEVIHESPKSDDYISDNEAEKTPLTVGKDGKTKDIPEYPSPVNDSTNDNKIQIPFQKKYQTSHRQSTGAIMS